MPTTEPILCRDDCPNFDQHVLEREPVADNGGIGGKPARLVAVKKGWLWAPGQTIVIRFLDGSTRQQQLVAQYANEWRQFANINFLFDNGTPYANIRITFNGPFNSSRIGKDALNAPRGEATVRLGSVRDGVAQVDVRRAVLHEFGHVLGCLHEHQHPDANIEWNTQELKKYYNGQGWSDQDINEQIIKRYSRTLTQYSEYDSESIMIYPIPAKCLKNSDRIDFGTDLSEKDKLFISKLYPR